MMIYVDSPHSQQSRAFCQGTSAYFSANLCSGSKNELPTQQDILYFLASDLQSDVDDRSHLRGKKEKKKTPWIDYVNVLQLLKRLSTPTHHGNNEVYWNRLFSVPTQKTLVQHNSRPQNQIISERDIHRE